MMKENKNYPHSKRIIKIGSKVPTNIFKVLSDSGEIQESILSDDIFKDKKIALFSVPGAFTQKSTNVQIPGYLNLAEKFLIKGLMR